MGKYLYCIIRDPEAEPRRRASTLRGRQARYPSSRAKLTTGHSGAGKELKELNVSGIEGSKVYSISGGKLSVLVSNVEIKEYLPTRENLMSHQKVIEEILKRHTLLPISFGTVTQSGDEVKKLLRKNIEEISKVLKKIEGKIELGLKVFWQNMPEIFQEIVKENREIQAVKSKGTVSRGTLLSVGELVAHALERKKNKESSLIIRPFLKIAEDFKKNELVRDDMILNANFLVERSKEKDFDLAINQLGEKYGQRMKFKYIGPVPPSNFIKLHLTLS